MPVGFIILTKSIADARFVGGRGPGPNQGAAPVVRLQPLYLAEIVQRSMAHGIGVALAGISIEVWAVMMAATGNGFFAFMVGTIGLLLGIVGGLLAEVPDAEEPMPSTA